MDKCLKIRFHGHACFSIIAEGKTIVFDPHDGHSIGITPPKIKGDYILVTHEHFDHNAVEVVRKPGSIVIVGSKLKEPYRDDFMEIKTIILPHDRAGGTKRGFVGAFDITVGGYRIVHLGDIGAVPEDGFFEKMSSPRVNLLFIPVGGYFTIEPYEAWEIAEKINPVLTVPMHYWVPGINLPIHPVQDFLMTAKTGRIEADGEYNYCGETQDKTKILYFKKIL